MKNFSVPDRNRNRYLPAFIAVPQLTAPPRALERVLGFIPNRGENGGCVRKGKYFEEYKTLFRTDISTRHTMALY